MTDWPDIGAALYFEDDSVQIYLGDCRDVLAQMPGESVHCVVTSPPYWGLRDYGLGGDALGLEPTPELFVQHLVEIFREVRRVLRQDGTVWLNLGDSYASGEVGRHDGRVEGSGYGAKHPGPRQTHDIKSGLKPKDLVGIPWRVAFALQADGWWLRSDIIWSKPNPMPESVTDRPTKSHEYLFLLTKADRYFYDADAIREHYAEASLSDPRDNENGHRRERGFPGHPYVGGTNLGGNRNGGRNKRTVWEIATQPYPEAHFATFPEKLVQPCIKAGTSEWGCCAKCLAPYERIVEVHDPEGRLGKGYHDHTDDMKVGQRGVFPSDGAPTRKTQGWRKTCQHRADVSKAIVLDPFGGAGTVGVVARKTGRRAILMEASEEYCEMMRSRMAQGVLI